MIKAEFQNLNVNRISFLNCIFHLDAFNKFFFKVTIEYFRQILRDTYAGDLSEP